MSIARHHNEWLSLIDQSGPFLSLPVLLRAFPQGLDKADTSLKQDLRLAYDEWLQERNDPAIHSAWIRFILTQALEFPDELIATGQTLPGGLSVLVPEHNETLRPDMAILRPVDDTGADSSEGSPVVALIHVYPPTQKLQQAVAGKRWNASPETRMMELLRATDIPLGLVTNGERWTVVYAPRNESVGYASWYASLWTEEPLTFQAFVSLLSARRFFGVAEGDTLPALLEESATDQQEITDQLGLQVREAVEVLVQVFDRVDQDSGRVLLQGIDEKKLYEAALTVMMRLVFLFCAEERELLPINEYPLYAQAYAVSNLGESLREIADKNGEEILERSFDAWCRLLATFRVVFAGVEHDVMRLPAYGGNLFDPDRFEFLEGRAYGSHWRDTPAEPLRVDNRTVLHLLEALQWLAVRIPGGGPKEKRRLSFRTLDIEDIGHVYEGLLDHTAVRATETVLGLTGAKGKDPELALSELERRLEQGVAELAEFLKKQTGRSVKALTKALTEAQRVDERKLRVACGNDAALFERVLPFAGLLRNDTFGYPVVIAAGSVYVTTGADRRSSGTHYTPRSLTEPIVQHTLEPLVFVGPAEGEPKERWKLKSAGEILALNVCDMAMGSGAFLVQACRYLSARLIEAWETAEEQVLQQQSAQQQSAGDDAVLRITPDGAPSTGAADERLVPTDPDERQAVALRIIAERCLYGVDKNPLAVEMAKLSLWLITLSKNKPFTFLDHALKCGDSLVGADERMFLNWARGGAPEQVTIFDDKLANLLADARQKRRELESFEVNDARDAERKADLLEEAEQAMEWVKHGCNLLVGTLLGEESEKEKRGLLSRLLVGYLHDEPVPGLDSIAQITRAAKERAFHWPFEFPEVFDGNNAESGGFDAFVGNPPFMGGQKITGNFGTYYREFLVNYLAGGKRGSADLCSYFFLRDYGLLKDGGVLGLLATNTIAQGDTRETGLERIENAGGKIIRALPSQKWPGQANLEVAIVWLHKGDWRGEYKLQEIIVSGISPFLALPGEVTGKPYRLAANRDKSFQGSIVLGMGFIMTPEEAQRLIDKNPKNKDVLFPYLNGKDLNSRPDQSPSRWVINFFDWPLDRSADGKWSGADETQKTLWLREGRVPSDYPDPVAADYPDCLRIVEEKVKPERTRKKPNGDYALRYPLYLKWWIYAEKRPKLYSTIAGMERVLVRARVADINSWSFTSGNKVFSDATVVVASEDLHVQSVLQCDVHTIWLERFASTMRSDIRYTATDCFETYPFPLPHSSCTVESVLMYMSLRKSILISKNVGLTELYSRVFEKSFTGRDITKLRELIVQTTRVHMAEFGWDDVNLEHGFHQTKQGLRFTISEKARREVLGRLLKLNHERYKEECEQGLHEKKKDKPKKKRKKKKSTDSNNTDLFY